MYELLLIARCAIAVMMFVTIILQSRYIEALQESEKAGNELITVQRKLIQALKNNLDARAAYIEVLEKKLEEKHGANLQDCPRDRSH